MANFWKIRSWITYHIISRTPITPYQEHLSHHIKNTYHIISRKICTYFLNLLSRQIKIPLSQHFLFRHIRPMAGLLQFLFPFYLPILWILSDCNKYRSCFNQRVRWHSFNYRVWIHSETRTWHDKNTQSYYG